MKLEFSRRIFEKSANIKFHENPSIWSPAVLCVTDRERDRERDETFRNFASKPKNHNKIVVPTDQRTLFPQGWHFSMSVFSGKKTRQYSLQKKKRVGRYVQLFKILIKAISL